MEARPVAARQPIFDPRQRVFGYELLFRCSLENYFPSQDGDAATSRVLDSFMSLGMETLWQDQRAFINFTHDALVRDLATLLPKHRLTVEILENVEPDSAIVAACGRLKRLGYQLALDDVTSLERQKPLLDLADVVKVDFTLTAEKQQQEISRHLRRRGKKLLAEKVETMEQFTKARSWGYDYFQGFFFCKPQIIAAKEIPAFKVNCLRLLEAAHRPELDFWQIENGLRNELALSYRLLRYLNSPLFGLRSEIRSLRHALTLLGEGQIRKWVSMVSIVMMASDKPSEFLATSLTRARFCELLSAPLVKKSEQADFFLMGLFSLLDAILGRTMADILEGVPLARPIKVALLGGENLHADVYRCALAYERANWAGLDQLVGRLGLKEEWVTNSYLESVQWASKLS